ncbi:MAG: DegV family protein, partial [Oscillospiraceae bacterium]|nr:DegV family protein [Oscillospiraceae bacterium]
MRKIKITCDSTCDLTKELYDRYNVSVIALGVNMGEDTRLDGETVVPDELYDYVSRTGKLPSTSAISIGSYEDFFKP